MPEKIISQEMSEKKNTSPLAPLLSAMCSRYPLLAAVAVIPAAAAFFIGSENNVCVTDTSAAALILILLGTVKYAVLQKKGITRADIRKNEKALDSRLMGSLGDIGGIGSTLGAITGIAFAFIQIYVKDGGAFSSGEFLIPLLTYTAQAICIGVMLAAMTSKDSIQCSMYIICSGVFGTSGKELIKQTSRAAHSSDAMKYLRNMAATRLTASVSVCIISIMSIVSGAGTLYSGVQCAFICLAASVLSDLAAEKTQSGFSEEKLTLWTKKHRTICAVNIIMFVILGFLFLFSFPSQSVYCNYPLISQYDYYEEVDNTIHPFSIPDLSEEAVPIITGFMVLTIFMMAVTSACVLTDKADLAGGAIPFRKYKAAFIAAAAVIIAEAAKGLIYPEQALNSLQCLVTASLVCFMIIVNVICGAVSGRKAQ